MITGDLKNQVDKIWNDFWTGGVSNPLTVIEQFTYLIFLKRLDDKQLKKEEEEKRFRRRRRRTDLRSCRRTRMAYL
jgi:type I restriction enzyme M protein